MALATFRQFVARIAPPVLRTVPGKRYVGALAKLMDGVAEASRQAVRAVWVGDRVGNGPAYDALGVAGEDLSLPRYPLETWANYHARLRRAWTDWPTAGHETSIQAQLAAAGFPSAVILYTPNWEPWTNWWSQFVVFFAAGEHLVTSAGPYLGLFWIGDGTTIGPTGITAEQLLALRKIIRKFKPAHWVCRAVIFELSGWTVGTGRLVGASGLVIGGEQVRVRAGVN